MRILAASSAEATFAQRVGCVALKRYVLLLLAEDIGRCGILCEFAWLKFVLQERRECRVAFWRFVLLRGTVAPASIFVLRLRLAATRAEIYIAKLGFK